MKQFKNHIIIGLIVLFSLAVLFLPVFLKKTGDKFTYQQTAIKLPPRPTEPVIVRIKQEELFQNYSLPPEPIKPPPPKPLQAKLEAKPISSSLTSIQDKKFVPVASKKTYMVQIASFKLEENAKALIKKLKAQGITAKYQKTNHTLYKVTIDNLHSESQAKAIQTKVANTMNLKGIIIQSQVS